MRGRIIMTQNSINLFFEIYSEFYKKAPEFLKAFQSVISPQSSYRFIDIEFDIESPDLISIQYDDLYDTDAFNLETKYFADPEGIENFRKDLQKRIDDQKAERLRQEEEAKQKKEEQNKNRELQEYLRLKKKYEENNTRWVKFTNQGKTTINPRDNVLEIGKKYELDRIEMHSWHTNIFLKDFPNNSFNSVDFDIPEEYMQEAMEEWKRRNDW